MTSRTPSQVHTTQQAITNTTYLDTPALAITPPSPLAGCWWWEDWLKDSSIAQVQLREPSIILNLHSSPSALHIRATNHTVKDAFTALLFFF